MRSRRLDDAIRHERQIAELGNVEGSHDRLFGVVTRAAPFFDGQCDASNAAAIAASIAKLPELLRR
jgi:hypothetical protein